MLSIIGSSGSGKTTLLRCINFLEFAESGTITVNGETFKPETYTDADGFNGTLGSQKNYFIRFYEMAGTVDKDKIIVGTLSDNYAVSSHLTVGLRAAP